MSSANVVYFVHPSTAKNSFYFYCQSQASHISMHGSNGVFSGWQITQETRWPTELNINFKCVLVMICPYHVFIHSLINSFIRTFISKSDGPKNTVRTTFTNIVQPRLEAHNCIHCFLWDAITHPFLDFNGSLSKPWFGLGYG